MVQQFDFLVIGSGIAPGKGGRPVKEVRVLDCTLRDGGYINNWEFGRHAIPSILKKLDQGVWWTVPSIPSCIFGFKEG